MEDPKFSKLLDVIGYYQWEEKPLFDTTWYPLILMNPYEVRWVLGSGQMVTLATTVAVSVKIGKTSIGDVPITSMIVRW